MKTLRFVTPAGEVAIVADDGLSVMQVAKAQHVEGIEADCGGSMVCGTCHVYVLDGLKGKLPVPSEMEEAVLEYVSEPHPDARLSCQLRVADCPEGIRFKIPPTQR